MNGSCVTILLVEDSETDALITRKALIQSKAVCSLTVVTDGQQAIDYLLNQNGYEDKSKYPRPGLILLDLHLPEMDGHQVLKRIKSDPALRAIPVVMLTSSEDLDDIHGSYDLGVNSYITKPVEYDNFYSMVSTVTRFWLDQARLPL